MSQEDSSARRLSHAEEHYQSTDHEARDRSGAISKDFQSLAAWLSLGTPAGREDAKKLYELGAYCQSYAQLTLTTELDTDVPLGTVVTGTSFGGSPAMTVNGVTFSTAQAGSTALEVLYVIPDDGVTELCSAGGNPSPQYDQCKSSEEKSREEKKMTQ